MKRNNFKNIFSKYKNIVDIYDISKIEDEYIVNNKNEKIYIYEIMPILILDKNKEKDNIFNNYNRFLRMQNENFQIYIDSQKINLKEYLKNIYDINDLENDTIKKNLLKNYIDEIEKYNIKNDIILKKYYIVVTSNNIINFEKSLNILTEIGCTINKIKGKDNLIKFLFNKINKVSL